MQIIVKDNKAYEFMNHGLYSNWEPCADIAVVPVEQMRANWLGSPMLFTLWEQIVSFMRWSQKTYKAESLITLFYHRETGEWRAWAFPQEPCGMTIKHLPEHELFKTDRALFGKGWVQMGSVHHHCNAGAFQSGTDSSDELDRDGVHITIGKVEEKEVEIHLRQVFSGQQSLGGIHQWVALPEWAVAIPKHLQYAVYLSAIKTVDDTPIFPTEWKERIIEKKAFAHIYSHRDMMDMFPDTIVGVAGRISARNTNSPYRETCRITMRKIIDGLKLTSVEAYKLISEVSMHKLPEQLRAVRTSLIQEAYKCHVPPFWPEELLHEMMVKDERDNEGRRMASLNLHAEM